MSLKLSFFTHKRLLLAISIASLMPVVQAQGFVDDAKVNINLRNFYLNRNFVDSGASKVISGPTDRGQASEWTQSIILDGKSGFTTGTVGFGLDTLGMWSVKLDGGRGTFGTQLLPVHDGNRPADEFGRLAVAGKMKLSKTELKMGEWMPLLPIVRADDGRSLPQTLKGAQITSKEISDLTLYGGQLTGNSQRNDAGMEKLSQNGVGKSVHGKSTVESDRFNFAGAEYTFNDKHTLVGAWYGQLEDIYHQQYFQLQHSQAVSDYITLGANIGYFIGQDDGLALGGDEDNRTLSGLFSLKAGGNTFYVGLQRLTGDTAWQRIAGTSGGALANDSYGSSYDSARERSWQLRHDYDFAALGVPGLTLMNRYIKGTNVHSGTVTDGEERGRETEVGYVFQSGVFKSMSLRWRNLTLRRDYGNTNSFDENRLIIQYPLSIL